MCPTSIPNSTFTGAPHLGHASPSLIVLMSFTYLGFKIPVYIDILVVETRLICSHHKVLHFCNFKVNHNNQYQGLWDLQSLQPHLSPSPRFSIRHFKLYAAQEILKLCLIQLSVSSYHGRNDFIIRFIYKGLCKFLCRAAEELHKLLNGPHVRSCNFFQSKFPTAFFVIAAFFRYTLGFFIICRITAGFTICNA